MIDNIVMFEQMGAINVADTTASLYNAILIDTPLGKYLTSNIYYFLRLHFFKLNYFVYQAPYFMDCISEHDLDELNIEIMRNTLYKAYLEDFYNFCKELGGATADVMCELLAVCVEKLFFS
jgi:V-type H+-transporting ATPase subunit d